MGQTARFGHDRAGTCARLPGDCPPQKSRDYQAPLHPVTGGVNPMAADAEIEAAVNAMRAIRTRGGKVHDDVLRAYARAALKAAELAQISEFQSLQKRAELLAAEARKAGGKSH